MPGYPTLVDLNAHAILIFFKGMVKPRSRAGITGGIR